MKRNTSSADLHLELLKDYKVHLNSDGRITAEGGKGFYTKGISIGFRDEGPDAWSSSEHFSGPAWVWTFHEGWEFYQNGVTITGYHGLSATVVNIDQNEVHVTTCIGEEY